MADAMEDSVVVPRGGVSVFRHIVLLELSESPRSAAVEAVVARLRTLPSEIDPIVRYEVGVDAGLAEGNATVGVVADFDDVDGYLVYKDHPAHLAVIAEQIRPLLVRRSAIQHHVESST